jgi:hypothetical protein
MFSAKRTSAADDVRKVLLTALIAALEDQRDKQRPKRGFTAVRALATGAVLYTAGRAGSRLLTDRLQTDSGEREEDDERYEEEEEYEEPEAEADEDEEYAEEDEEYEEPEAEEEDEPEAEADEDEYDEDEEEDEQEDIPERPSRSRSPVGRS